MKTFQLVGLLLCGLPLSMAAQQAAVQIEPPSAHGPRALQAQTASAVVRDYIEAWSALHSAMEQNRADLLSPAFTGTAQEKLTAAIQSQIQSQTHSVYRDKSHDVQIVFYSPEGLSIQLIDRVKYEQEIWDQGKKVAETSVHARFLVVLSPSETRWQIRILQAEPE